MHIFCDESGGFEKGLFTVCSVCIEPRDASHIIKDMRKTFRFKDEIKGSSLTPEQRSYFFDYIENKSEATSIVVKFTKRDPIAGWGASSLPQHIMYKHMLFEACAEYNFDNIQHVNITPDGGKYSKRIMADIQARLQHRFTSELSETIRMKFADSQTSSGIQVADIISSTVYRALSSGLSDIVTNPFCGGLVKKGRLSLQTMRLTSIAPKWLSERQQ